MDQLVRRLRRLRRSPLLRDAVADVRLSPSRLICPVFVGEMDRPHPVASLPQVNQWPVAEAADWIGQLSQRGLKQFLLFGVTPPQKKDARGTYAADPRAPVNRLLQEVKRRRLDALMIADLCFCEYTDHGQCGVVGKNAEGEARDAEMGQTVDNDATLEMLRLTAVAQARAGADVVAPSGMMDGQVGAIRAALDQAGFVDTAILSYSVKYASTLYGPFREAGGGTPGPGTDRRTHQMDFRRTREWRTELELDLAEGADMVMVKPALAYLDVVHQVRAACDVPVVAYHVSGEYAMLHAAAQRGWLNLRDAAMEHTCAIHRAGADLIVTYFAPQLLEWLTA